MYRGIWIEFLIRFKEIKKNLALVLISQISQILIYLLICSLFKVLDENCGIEVKRELLAKDPPVEPPIIVYLSNEELVSGKGKIPNKGLNKNSIESKPGDEIFIDSPPLIEQVSSRKGFAGTVDGCSEVSLNRNLSRKKLLLNTEQNTESTTEETASKTIDGQSFLSMEKLQISRNEGPCNLMSETSISREELNNITNHLEGIKHEQNIDVNLKDDCSMVMTQQDNQEIIDSITTENTKYHTDEVSSMPSRGKTFPKYDEENSLSKKKTELDDTQLEDGIHRSGKHQQEEAEVGYTRNIQMADGHKNESQVLCSMKLTLDRQHTQSQIGKQCVSTTAECTCDQNEIHRRDNHAVFPSVDNQELKVTGDLKLDSPTDSQSESPKKCSVPNERNFSLFNIENNSISSKLESMNVQNEKQKQLVKCPTTKQIIEANSSELICIENSALEQILDVNKMSQAVVLDEAKVTVVGKECELNSINDMTPVDHKFLVNMGVNYANPHRNEMTTKQASSSEGGNNQQFQSNSISYDLKTERFTRIHTELVEKCNHGFYIAKEPPGERNLDDVYKLTNISGQILNLSTNKDANENKISSESVVYDDLRKKNRLDETEGTQSIANINITNFGDHEETISGNTSECQMNEIGYVEVYSADPISNTNLKNFEKRVSIDSKSNTIFKNLDVSVSIKSETDNDVKKFSFPKKGSNEMETTEVMIFMRILHFKNL